MEATEQQPTEAYSEVKKIAFFAVAILQAGVMASQIDGTLRKASCFLDTADEGFDCLTLDVELFKAQRAALEKDSEGMAELIADCAEHFDIADDVLEERIERTIDRAFRIYCESRAMYEDWT